MSEANVIPQDQLDAIHETFELQRKHQWVVARSSASERIAKLQRLHDVMVQYRNDLKAAMLSDFGKSSTEVDVTEIGCVNSEIRHAIRHLRSWMTPRRVSTPLFLIGTASKIMYQPKGVCLIISPWNFPINLTLSPLVSAVAAGNCAILKPSEFTPHSSAVMKKIIAECFPPEEVSMFEGDVMVSQALTALPFNHIFFTGSVPVGKMIMQAAAVHHTSVTLELGGKSPVVVDEHCDLDHAAAKIVWIKCMNAGQICISPDYVLVQEKVYDQLLEKLVLKIKKFYGETLEQRRQSPDYCMVVSPKHFQRQENLLEDALTKGARLYFGGNRYAEARFFEPTVLTDVPETAELMQEELFGPLLPVKPYKDLPEALEYINNKPRPLALYVFSRRKKFVDTVLAETRAGGGTVNDCGTHFYQPNLPFGGVNHSGIGSCHGEAGFLEFSNHRGVVYQNRIFPHTNLFLPPYRKNPIANWLLEGVVKWL